MCLASTKRGQSDGSGYPYGGSYLRRSKLPYVNPYYGSYYASPYYRDYWNYRSPYYW